MPNTYQEIRSWSPRHGDYVRRISMPNDRGHELFMLLLDPSSGTERRAVRAAALDAIQSAIERGAEPGEVRVDPAKWKRSIDAYLKQERAA